MFKLFKQSQVAAPLSTEITILIACELTYELGHVRPLATLIRALKARGCAVILAVPDTSKELGLIDSLDVPYVQAPTLNNSHREEQPSTSYADLLRHSGWSNVDTLRGLTGAWRELFVLTGANLVLCHHSPTALLAAKTLSVAAIRIGTGFACPPSTFPSQAIRPWQRFASSELEAIDIQVCRNANAVLSLYGSDEVGSVGELWQEAKDIRMTFKELDHYSRAVVCERYWGALLVTKISDEVPRDVVMDSYIFAHLQKNYKHFNKTVSALINTALSGQPIVLYCPGATSREVDQWFKQSKSLLTVKTEVMNVQQVIPNCRFLMGHAGHALTHQALAYGIPVLALPTNVEQHLLALRIASAGLGLAINPEVDVVDIKKNIELMLVNSNFSIQAAKFASSLVPQIDKIAHMAVEYLLQETRMAYGTR